MSQSHLHLRSKLSKCQKWKVLYTMIDALVTVSSVVSPYLLSLKHWTYESPKNKTDMLSEAQRSKELRRQLEQDCENMDYN